LEAGCLQAPSPAVELVAAHSRLEAAVDSDAYSRVVLCPAVLPVHLPQEVLPARSAVLLPAVLDLDGPVDLDVPQVRSRQAVLAEH
jgi:hypothetical protein